MTVKDKSMKQFETRLFQTHGKRRKLLKLGVSIVIGVIFGPKKLFKLLFVRGTQMSHMQNEGFSK